MKRESVDPTTESSSQHTGLDKDIASVLSKPPVSLSPQQSTNHPTKP